MWQIPTTRDCSHAQGSRCRRRALPRIAPRRDPVPGLPPGDAPSPPRETRSPRAARDPGDCAGAGTTTGAGQSCFPLGCRWIGRIQHTMNRVDQLAEAGLRLTEATAAFGRQAIVARAAIVGGVPPLSRDEPLHEESLERWVQGAFLDLQHAARGALDVLGNAVAVHHVQRESLEDE